MFCERLNLHIVWLGLWPRFLTTWPYQEKLLVPCTLWTPPVIKTLCSSNESKQAVRVSLSNIIYIKAQWINVATLKSPFHNTVFLPHTQSTHVGHNNSLKHKSRWRKTNAMLLEKRKEGARESEREKERGRETNPNMQAAEHCLLLLATISSQLLS